MGIHGRMGSSVGYSHDMAQQKPSSWDITGCDGKNGKVNIEDPASLLDLSFQQLPQLPCFLSDVIPRSQRLMGSCQLFACTIVVEPHV